MVHPRRGDSDSGFSLVEVLVALAILGLALLLGLGLLWQQRRVLVRLEARAAAERALGDALETLRSGAVPLSSGAVELGGASVGNLDPSAELAVVVRVIPAEPPAGLYRGQVLARCTLRGQTVTRTVETQFWRPDKLRSH